MGVVGKLFANSEVEPAVVVNPTNPRNLIALWQQDRWNTGGARGLVAANSFDGGRTWRRQPLPFGACMGRGPLATRVSDPWLSFGPNGIAYASGLGSRPPSFLPPGMDLSNTIFLANSILVATSRDGGKTWRGTEVFNGPSGGIDRDVILADPRRSNRVYLVWQQMAGSWLSISVDAGKHWGRPREITRGKLGKYGSEANTLVEDPRTGTLYDLYLASYQASRPRRMCGTIRGRHRCYTFPAPKGIRPFVSDLAVIRSRDGGRRWSRPTRIARSLAVDSVGPHAPAVRAESEPFAAVDARGRISVVWQDARFSVGRYDQIALAQSTNGWHWDKPRRVDQGGQAAIIPYCATNGSTLGVTYYRVRVASHQLTARYWFRPVRGSHLGRPQALSAPFDLRDTPSSQGYFVGDYQGLSAQGTGFRAVFVVTSHHRTAVVTKSVVP